MRAGHIMERSYLFNLPHRASRHLGTPGSILLMGLLYLLSVTATQASQLRVAVSTLDSGIVAEHVQSGLQSELSRQGYVIGTNLTWINNKGKAKSSDVNVTISTAEHHPFITLVNQQGLATEINRDTSEFREPLTEQYEINFIKKLLPGINTIGVIIDKNAIDMHNTEQFLARQEQKGMHIVYYYIEKSDELRGATRMLAPVVNAIYLPCHITDMPELEQIVTVAERNDVALIGEDHRSIKKGVFAVYNIDYFQVGRDTADLLVRLAEGRDTFSGRDDYLARPVLSLNLDAAARMGVELSSDIINKAKFIIE
ncbi:ABC transporter substrate-binding protein [Moritella sp. F3]|nr:ABC transporter substrate-binding protein [Moritella sp. F1]GIC80831.1 ABC transporter substrate-binding protein [Moritella sp. F3]